MAHSFRLIITEAVNEDGTGGTVIDDAAVVIPDDQMQGLLAAFADAYAIPQVATGNKVNDANGNEVDEMAPEYTQARWLSICLRNYSNIITEGYRAKMADLQKQQVLEVAKENAKKSQKIVIKVGDPVSTPEVI